ncbi:hypothetical protein ACQKNX_07775 [Lysinibacillus sp. NPDC093712]|uniref:hypothetical protein n=1 Tax=Lysinibacillus sp. NPDC093712 TaxID=3390579 RepID=UPI003D008582
MNDNILTEKIINKVYGDSIKNYKEYIKAEIQKVVTLLQRKLEREEVQREIEIERRDKLIKEGAKWFNFSTLPISTTGFELMQYESLLRNIDEWNILDIDINSYEMLDIKVKKLHNLFIDKMVESVANKLINGEIICFK